MTSEILAIPKFSFPSSGESSGDIRKRTRKKGTIDKDAAGLKAMTLRHESRLKDRFFTLSNPCFWSVDHTKSKFWRDKREIRRHQEAPPVKQTEKRTWADTKAVSKASLVEIQKAQSLNHPKFSEDETTVQKVKKSRHRAMPPERQKKWKDENPLSREEVRSILKEKPETSRPESSDTESNWPRTTKRHPKIQSFLDDNLSASENESEKESGNDSRKNCNSASYGERRKAQIKRLKCRSGGRPSSNYPMNYRWVDQERPISIAKVQLLMPKETPNRPENERAALQGDPHRGAPPLKRWVYTKEGWRRDLKSAPTAVSPGLKTGVHLIDQNHPKSIATVQFLKLRETPNRPGDEIADLQGDSQIEPGV